MLLEEFLQPLAPTQVELVHALADVVREHEIEEDLLLGVEGQPFPEDRSS